MPDPVANFLVHAPFAPDCADCPEKLGFVRGPWRVCTKTPERRRDRWPEGVCYWPEVGARTAIGWLRGAEGRAARQEHTGTAACRTRSNRCFDVSAHPGSEQRIRQAVRGIKEMFRKDGLLR
ncbi:hypothetical protein F7P85_15995 [Kerstersia gyiorum]|nr:hypothetical protein F7P85_15995 [Kerstersia gyiorum]